MSSAAEAALARAVTQRARRVLVVTDVTKFGQSAPLIACKPRDVTAVLIAKLPDRIFHQKLIEWEIEVVVVPDSKTGKTR